MLEDRLGIMIPDAESVLDFLPLAMPQAGRCEEFLWLTRSRFTILTQPDRAAVWVHLEVVNLAADRDVEFRSADADVNKSEVGHGFGISSFTAASASWSALLFLQTAIRFEKYADRIIFRDSGTPAIA